MSVSKAVAMERSGSGVCSVSSGLGDAGADVARHTLVCPRVGPLPARRPGTTHSPDARSQRGGGPVKRTLLLKVRVRTPC